MGGGARGMKFVNILYFQVADQAVSLYMLYLELKYSIDTVPDEYGYTHGCSTALDQL